MVLAQLERLRKDSSELEHYALKLKKRGKLTQMKNIIEKRIFIDEKIKLIKEPSINFST
tara:strand:+ start:273 stop:449 length:177 start_codon:yes stop_codon:yes gene_type:complete